MVKLLSYSTSPPLFAFRMKYPPKFLCLLIRDYFNEWPKSWLTIDVEQFNLCFWGDDHHVVPYILQMLYDPFFINSRRSIDGKHNIARIEVDLRPLIGTINDI